MTRIELGNLIESPTPLENINDLWVDIDENTGDIRAIHRYNKDKGEWEPYLVSVDYLKSEEPEEDSEEPEDGGSENPEDTPED